MKYEDELKSRIFTSLKLEFDKAFLDGEEMDRRNVEVVMQKVLEREWYLEVCPYTATYEFDHEQGIVTIYLSPSVIHIKLSFDKTEDELDF